jgi:hypothetical protein
MIARKFSLVVILLLSAVAGNAADVSEADIRAKLAALSNRTVKSVSGRFVVVGTNRVESFALAGWCEDASKQIEHITGVKLPFGGRRIVVDVRPENSDGIVRYPAGGGVAARVYLNSYDNAYKLRGRQALCCSIIGVYTKQPAKDMPSMPLWLWAGIEQTLLFDVRTRNMEHALMLWRSGKLLSPHAIMLPASAEVKASDLGFDKMAAYAAFVRFISDQASRKQIFSGLFAGNDIEHDLIGYLVGKKSKDSLGDVWERWILGQSRIVRGSVTITTRLLEQLQAELKVYPGACGVPLDSNIDPGVSFDKLIKFRSAEWMPAFINRKSGRLSMIAAGHAVELTNVAALYNEYLSGLERGTPTILLLSQLDEADKALSRLAHKVSNSGGTLVENVLPGRKIEEKKDSGKL